MPERRPLNSRRRVEPTIADLEAELTIDQNKLEDACRNHPDLLYEVGKQLSLLISRRDQAKKNLKVAEAEADLEIRRKFEGEKKPTETEIGHRVQLDDDVLEATDALLELERQVGETWAMKEAFQARGSAIEFLIKLYLGNYYGSDVERPTRDIRTADAVVARRALSERRRPS